jgi:hypothetical protein
MSSRTFKAVAPALQAPGDQRPTWRAHHERSPEAKETALWLARFRRTRKALLKDAAGDDPTTAQCALADSAAALITWLEQQVLEMAEGKDVDISKLNGSINTMRRSLETLGIERRAKDVTPSLHDYLAKRPVTIDVDTDTKQ